MAMNRVSREKMETVISIVEECAGEGFLLEPNGPKRTAFSEAATRLGCHPQQIVLWLRLAKHRHGLEVDPASYKPNKAGFTVADVPSDGEAPVEELIAIRKARHLQRKAHSTASKLRQVTVHLDGPIGLAFFGDPHVDDDGCAWGDLEEDVRICQRTEGMFAADVGDDQNNWVGRLAKLYANQETTARQSRQLIEWLMGSLPWLLRIKGNHDTWNTEKGDIADYIHRLVGGDGILEESGARIQLNLPSGASARIHVRHDFPGGSQFNPAHALVRETLFGYRDHIMACGHRHTAGYIPVWHNDPPRLCHGFRVGAYKDFGHYAKEKGFQDGNWARSMGAVIDPAFADDPVRFIKPFFDLKDMADYLNWKRRGL